MTAFAEGSFRRSWLVALALLGISVVANVLVLANPGYFSHDEWQRADDVGSNGLSSYVQAYGKLHAGPEFGFPVRPIGFIQQGVSALWMTRAPIVPHGIDVLVHAAVVIAFWVVLLGAGLSRRKAVLAAIVLAISPLATMAVGWVGASFDRWYVLFALVCAHGVVMAARAGLNARSVALVLAGSAGAILSKETAIMLPAALVVAMFALHRAGQVKLDRRATLAAIGLSCVPILCYLVIRWPAIQATLAGGGGPYSPSLSNLPGNALAYFAQPFVPKAVELVSMPLLPRWQWVLGIVMHVLLLGALWRRAGWLAMLTYLAAFFVFLLPVLTLPMQGAHYLYGSGLAFALAVTLVMDSVAESSRLHAVSAMAALFLLSFLFGRSIYIQQSLYSAGKCQSEFISSFEPMAEEAVLAGSLRLHVVGAPGAREYIALRTVFGRSHFMEGGRWPTVVGSASAETGDANFTMRPDCRVTR